MKRLLVAAVCAATLVGCTTGQSVRATSANPVAASSTSSTPSTDTTVSTTPGPATTAPGNPSATTSGASGPSTTAATPPTSAVESPPFKPAALTWGACTKEKASDVPKGADCSTLVVPLDYAEPNGPSVNIALMRVKASHSRVGSLLYNPGGPGASGIDYFASNLAGFAKFSPNLQDHFDLIGFDPRGVGLSDPVACVDGSYFERTAYLDDTPDTPAEQAALDAAKKEFNDACTAKYGTSLRFYSTVNTAKDMDVIRAALGDDQLNYIGVSYGTFLGGVYANLFPERVRAFVLDGAYDPTKDDGFVAAETQLVGFEKTFGSWAADCQNDPGCPFHDADVAGRWDRLVKQLDSSPVAASDGRLANDTVMRVATLLAMYSKDFWASLDQALADAELGKGDGLFSLADLYEERNAKNDWGTINQAYKVISCASGLEAPPPADPVAAAAKLVAEAPRFAAGFRAADFSPECPDLGIKDPSPASLRAYTGSGPILIVGGKNDPATPFRWAEQMVTDLGAPSAGGTANVDLVTFTGEGHSTFLTSTCTTSLMVKLISTAKQAGPGIVCDADKPVDKPAYFDSLPAVAQVQSFDVHTFNAPLGLEPTKFYSVGGLTNLAPEAVAAAYASGWKGAGFTMIPSDGKPDANGFYSSQFVRAKDNAQLAIIAVSATDVAKQPSLAALATKMGASKTLVLEIAFPN